MTSPHNYANSQTLSKRRPPIASRDTLDTWAATLDEIGELYGHVLATVSDLPEPRTDLAGTSSKGKPPPLPGGIKLALAGPVNVYAPPDDMPHPRVYLNVWCAHVARRSRSIPPTPDRWAAQIAWLRERLAWITEEADHARDLAAVRALLRNVCNADRPSQAEQVADRWLRGEAAMRELQARWHEIDTPLTREEVETIWPDELDDDAWNRIRLRKHRARYRVPALTYHPEWVAEELV